MRSTVRRGAKPWEWHKAWHELAVACTSAYSNNYRQTYVLLLLGFVFLTLAWLGMFNSFSIGVLLFGLGMLGVAPFSPRRFLSAGWLMTSLGVATFLMFRHSIPDSQALTAHLLAIGLGLLGIAWMARLGYIHAGALTPAFFVVGVGVTEDLQAIHLIPSTVGNLAKTVWVFCSFDTVGKLFRSALYERDFAMCICSVPAQAESFPTVSKEQKTHTVLARFLPWFLSRFPSSSLDLASLRLDWFLWLQAGEHTWRNARKRMFIMGV